MHLIRGWLAIAVASACLIVGEVVQRFIVAPWSRLRPSRRIRVLGVWQQIMAWVTTRPVAFISGCVIPKPARIVPTEPGHLIVMNHQSLFDIPLVIQTVVDGYPRIVTRQRYSRFIPTISYMVRLYQYPVVDPTANPERIRASLDGIEEAGRTTDVPIAVFPEGTRSKNGEIGRFRKGALTRLLAARPWTVWVFVADGFWQSRRFRDFIGGLADVVGKMEHAGTLEWTDPGADSEEFIETVRNMMVEQMAAMRGAPPA